MARLAERIARLREELARQEVIQIVAPEWAKRPFGEPAPAAEPAAEEQSWAVIDATQARKLRTPRQKRRR